MSQQNTELEILHQNPPLSFFSQPSHQSIKISTHFEGVELRVGSCFWFKIGFVVDPVVRYNADVGIAQKDLQNHVNTMASMTEVKFVRRFLIVAVVVDVLPKHI